MKKYKCVNDYTGGYCAELTLTAQEWLGVLVGWRAQRGYGKKKNDEELDFWRKKIEDGAEEELIEYLADAWDLEIKEVKE